MTLRIEHNLELEHFRQMEALEAACYSADFIAPADEAYAWYCAHPHSVVAAVESGRVAGFVNLLPVRPELFERTLAGAFNDAGMTAGDILSLDECAEGPFELFLSCVVVGEAHRGRGLARWLLARALEPYCSAGLSCTRVVTDNVTPEGVRFSECLGFRFACLSDHETRVYVHDVSGLANALDLT